MNYKLLLLLLCSPLYAMEKEPEEERINRTKQAVFMDKKKIFISARESDDLTLSCYEIYYHDDNNKNIVLRRFYFEH